MTIAQSRESKFFRLQVQRPEITSLQLHSRSLFVFKEQNFPPNRFMPKILPSQQKSDVIWYEYTACSKNPVDKWQKGVKVVILRIDWIWTIKTNCRGVRNLLLRLNQMNYQEYVSWCTLCVFELIYKIMQKCIKYYTYSRPTSLVSWHYVYEISFTPSWAVATSARKCTVLLANHVGLGYMYASDKCLSR